MPEWLIQEPDRDRVAKALPIVLREHETARSVAGDMRCRQRQWPETSIPQAQMKASADVRLTAATARHWMPAVRPALSPPVLALPPGCEAPSDAPTPVPA